MGVVLDSSVGCVTAANETVGVVVAVGGGCAVDGLGGAVGVFAGVGVGLRFGFRILHVTSDFGIPGFILGAIRHLVIEARECS